MKFMYHSASFGAFLFLLILASTNVSANEEDQMRRQNQRGPAPNILELTVVLYVFGKDGKNLVVKMVLGYDFVR